MCAGSVMNIALKFINTVCSVRFLTSLIVIFINMKVLCIPLSHTNTKSYDISSVKVSIIVPVYNTDKYLDKCLNSLLNQTHKNIEIICINDGSVDNSLAILNQFKQRDKRIKVINKQNEGVSIARNVGLSFATGEYITFVDSDDYVTNQFVEKPLNKILKTNADIVVFRNYLDDGDIIPKIKPERLDYLSKVDFVEKEDIVPFLDFIWNKLYRSDFLKQNNIKFIPHIKTAEDLIFNLECLYVNSKWVFLSDALYHYLTRKDSATSNGLEGLISDMRSFDVFLNTSKFKKATSVDRKLTLNRILCGIVFYTNRNLGVWDAFKRFLVLKQYLKFLERQFSQEEFQYNRSLLGRINGYNFNFFEYACILILVKLFR